MIVPESSDLSGVGIPQVYKQVKSIALKKNIKNPYLSAHENFYTLQETNHHFSMA
jgi:hypothetical protein